MSRRKCWFVCETLLVKFARPRVALLIEFVFKMFKVIKHNVLYVHGRVYFDEV